MGKTTARLLAAILMATGLSAAVPPAVVDVSHIVTLVVMAAPNFIPAMNTSALSVQVSFTWTAPTVHADGSPVTAPLAYIVYAGIPGNMTAFDTLADTADTFYQPLVPGKLQCYAVTAVDAGVESSLSPLACVTMPANGPVPAAPSGVVVT